MALTTQIDLSVIAALSGAAADFGTTKFDLKYTKQFAWASGVGANQADMIWSDQRTLTASATEDLDLVATLTSHLGGTFTLARIKGLLVFAAAANTNNVNVTRTATAGSSVFLADGDGVAVHPGGLFVLLSPTAAGRPASAAWATVPIRRQNSLALSVHTGGSTAGIAQAPGHQGYRTGTISSRCMRVVPTCKKRVAARRWDCIAYHARGSPPGC
jgi:hypothetical protein